MKRADYIKQLEELTEMNIKVEATVQMSVNVGIFLKLQAERIGDRVKSENIGDEEIQTCLKELDSITNKVEFERRELNKVRPELQKIQDQIKVLIMINEQGLIED